MSLNGFHRLAPMGVFNPLPPPTKEVHHTAPPISVAEESTFDAWMALPEGDGRTLEEFAANPVVRLVTLEHDLPKPPPPPAPPAKRGQPIVLEQGMLYAPIVETGTLKNSVRPPPDSDGIIKR